MVGWPWSSAGSGVVDGHAREEEFVQPDDMDSKNLPHVEKDVLAAGRAACYKVLSVSRFFVSCAHRQL